MATKRIEEHGLQVDQSLHEFVNDRVIPGTGVAVDSFWHGFAALVDDLTPENQALLDRRDDLQQKIDVWHLDQRGQDHDPQAYREFLLEIGYLIP